jgi:hypothetical protein
MAQPLQNPSPDARTSIDSLLELLIAKGRMDLNTVSITLGISPRIIEEWAKVLENGKLIKVNYEVGKMYLEPLELVSGPDQGKSIEIRTEAQKSALQNEMEVEKITLDKFSKNLDELAVSVSGMETLYRQKIPNIQKLLSEVDLMAAPLTKRAKDMDKMQKDAEMYFGQLDKRVDAAYEKINSMEGSSAERNLRQKEEMLKASLARADQAKATLLDLEDTRQALYKKISADMERQMKEFRTGLKASIDQIYTELKADAADSVAIEKEIKTELVETAKTSGEMARVKKEMESSRTELANARNSFKDRYQKLANEITNTSKAVEQKYQTAQVQMLDLKESVGEVSRLHDSIAASKAELEKIRESIRASKETVDSILETLKMLDTLKNVGQPEKARAVAELSRKALGAKVKGESIKSDLKKASSAIKGQSEGTG